MNMRASKLHQAWMALPTVFAIGACAGPQKEEAVGDRSTPSEKAPAKSSEPATKALAEFPSTPDAEFRAQKPPPLPTTPHFAAPVPIQRKLKNGIPVLIVENHQLPIVAVDLVIKTGHDGDPIAKAGLSDLVAAMLTEGTRTRSASDFAEAVDSLAAQLTAQA